MARLSTEEREAIKQRAAEMETAGRRGRGAGKAAAEAQDVLDKIAEMPAPDRALAERVHAVVTAAAPELAPRLWYGMPAYARGGKVVCFFRSGQMDGTRYSVFGFNDTATLDDGGMWATSWALTELDEAAEAEITALVERAVG
ncbi:iron chaperone [Blastococcus sp. SYSU DS0753]